jgi:geranylgeranyl transferase type-2 subunit alpha
MLNADERNFHVWNYRNWLNSVCPDTPRELAFLAAKLDQNPSNFSAYHFKIHHLAGKYRPLLDPSQRLFSLPEPLLRQ